MINISGLIFKLYRLVGQHELDSKIGIYSRQARYMIADPSDFGLNDKEFIKAFNNRDHILPDNLDYRFYHYRPVKPVALGKVIEEVIEAHIYHTALYKRIIYQCPITGSTVPLLHSDFRSDMSISDSVSRILMKYYNDCNDTAYLLLLRLLDRVKIDKCYSYEINTNSDFLLMRKSLSFKEERFDMVLLDMRDSKNEVESIDHIEGVFNGRYIEEE